MSTLYHATQLPLSSTKICISCPPSVAEKPLDAFEKGRNQCKECRKVYKSNYDRANKERFRANRIHRQASYRQRHAERRRAQQCKHAKTFYQNHPLKNLEKGRKRKAIQKGATAGIVSYEHILERDGYWCCICEKGILPHHALHFDHVIPLAHQGTHTEDNIKPTHKQCNLRKKDKLLSEMTAYQRRGVV